MSPSILVVEDYDDLRSVIVAALLRGHFACDVASGDDAVDRLRGKHYDAILLAPHLPIISDPVVHFLQENQPGEMSKVVLMTNPDLEDDAPPPAKCRVLAKPFNTADLLAKLSPKG